MRRSAVVLLAFALAGAGCGGDDDPDEPEQASTNDPLACVQDAGLKALATQGDEPLGITGGLRVQVPPNNLITVDFFSDAEQAKSYSEGQAGFLVPTGGTSKVIDDTTVISAARSGAEGELAQVERCIG